LAGHAGTASNSNKKLKKMCQSRWTSCCYVCRFRYKEDYELFKLYVTIVTLLLASVICFFVNYRSLESSCVTVDELFTIDGNKKDTTGHCIVKLGAADITRHFYKQDSI